MHTIHHFSTLLNSRWVEQDPKDILDSVKVCLEKAVSNLDALNISASDIKGKSPVHLKMYKIVVEYKKKYFGIDISIY